MHVRNLIHRCRAVFFLLAFLATPLWAQSGIDYYNGHEVVANQVLVKFKIASRQRIMEVQQAEDTDIAEQVSSTGVHRFRSRSRNTAALISSLGSRPDVEYVEPDYIVRAITAPNDTAFGNLWGLNNTGQVIGGSAGVPGADIGAVAAWNTSTGSRANVVVVIDTGVDYTHPDLTANIWSAPSVFTVSVGGVNMTCPAGSHGFNAITNSCDPMDDNNHGTHVAGTIGAVGNNSMGVAGVNQVASIIGAKFLDASGSGSTSNAVKAIDFAIQVKNRFGAGANVRVLSNSWGGGGFSQSLLDAVNRANAADMLFVAAAGNSSQNNDTIPNYPSNYSAPNVVAVAATDNLDHLAGFSNYGASTVHLGAPGVYIYSTLPGNSYAFYSGTSMATPHVSGAAALVLSACPLNTSSLKSNLVSNVDGVGSLAGRTISGGRLDVNKALSACSGSATPDFTATGSPASQSVAPGATGTYTIGVTPKSGFTGTVSLAVSGLPANTSASFTPASLSSGNSTLQVTTGSTTPQGIYPLTVTAASGALSHTVPLTLVVAATAKADFALAISPSSRTITRGRGANYTLMVTSSGGFAGVVNYGVSGLPVGSNATFTGSQSNPNVTTMRVTTTSGTPRGAYSLSVTGVSGGLTYTVAASLTVK